MRRRPSSSSSSRGAGLGKAPAPATGPASVLVSILTSSRPDLLALSYESVAASVAASGVESASKSQKYSYTVRVIVNSTDQGHYTDVRAIVPASVSVVRTESNGRPGKGHNSVLENFRSSPGYKYCVLVDGDDFLFALSGRPTHGGCVFDIGSAFVRRGIDTAQYGHGDDRVALLQPDAADAG